MISLNEIESRGHQQVSIFQDAKSGLVAIVAVHDTTLGPGLGGCRMKEYRNLNRALYDALLLSEGMTYKNSLAGLNLGGGKSVIVRDSQRAEGRKEIFEAFGRCVESLDGVYITAEDMGTSVSDMEAVLSVTEHVTGRDPKQGGGGDPSPWTAEGVYAGILACLERTFGSADPSGRHIAIQGVGHVGLHLARRLVAAGAKITVADVREESIEAVLAELPASVASIEEITSVECDVFAPCAVGGIINEESVTQLRCSIVAGAANNQLSSPEVERELAIRKVLYAPDFAINSGGVILCADELEPGGFSEARVRERVQKIHQTINRIFDRAAETGALAGEVALELAMKRIEEARGKE